MPGFEIAATSVPASEVGGDFFDYIWLDPEPQAERLSLCIAIGDVAGKGMRAAMTAVMSSGMIAAKLDERRSLEETLQSVNRLAFRKASSSKFTALCLASLNASTRELRWVNAGSAEPLLASAEGARFLATKDPRLPLGVRSEVPYRAERTMLHPGDVLVLYTDGLPEAQSPEQDVFGYEALQSLLASLPTEDLSASQIRDALLSEVQRFTQGFTQQDDMTLIVIKSGALP